MGAVSYGSAYASHRESAKADNPLPLRAALILGSSAFMGLGPPQIDQVLPGHPTPSGSLGRLVG
jgi:hypothetical protein